MSEVSARYQKHVQAQQQAQNPGKGNHHSPGERKALALIRKEAKKNGATLHSDGEGGLAPSLALGVFRRDGWRCSNDGCPDPKNDLDLDHITGHPKEIAKDPEAWGTKLLRLAVKEGVGKKDNRFIHVLCRSCHNAVHERERAIEAGEKPKPMPGQGKPKED